jgi:hypothetical protein
MRAMANYFLHVKIFARGKGSKVTKAAAYRAGERIRHERTGSVHDYTDRTDVAHAEIVLPTEYANQVGSEEGYFANHCPHCGALQEDYLLHAEPVTYFSAFRVRSRGRSSARRWLEGFR